MCVRTLMMNDTDETSVTHNNGVTMIDDGVVTHSRTLQNNKSKLTKIKEKCMKIHDEIAEREQVTRDETIQHEKNLIVETISAADKCLATSTAKYSLLLEHIERCYTNFRLSNVYKILFLTSQPAHVIMIAAVLCITSAIVPKSDSNQIAGHPHSRATSFIYLTSFVVHFGAQIWMTFISGLSLYFALPRHTFGEVQRVLFPRYFTINACLSLTTLLIFVKHHPANTWDAEIAIQVGGMSGAFFLELMIRLYLTPPLLALMIQKNMIERAAGIGNEIGRHNPGTLKHCPHYLKIHHAFRRVHVGIAMGNILTMACTVLHLHYIASKLCVL